MNDDLTQKLPGDESIAPPDDDKLSVLINAVQSLSADFQALRTAVQGVEVRLEALEITVTKRLLDTKPIWESALAAITETRAELAETRAELAETRAELRTEMANGFRKLSTKIQLLHEDSLTLRTDQRQLERRVDALESKSL